MQVSPQFDHDMQMRAKVERVTRGKGGRQQTALAVATQIRSSRASLRGREECCCDHPGNGDNPPLQVLDDNGGHQRRRKKGEPRQLDLTGGCARGTRKTRRGRGRGRRGQARTVVSRGVAVGGAFSTSSSTEAEVSDEEIEGWRGGLHQREGGNGDEREDTEHDVLNVSEHLEAMSLDNQAVVTPAAGRRDTHHHNLTFHPPSASTPSNTVRPRPQLGQAEGFSTPHSLHKSCRDIDSTSCHSDGFHGDDRLSSSHCAHVSEMSVDDSSVLAESTPSDRLHCGVYCTLRGKCNH